MSQSSPRIISVVIPLYNKRPHISTAIDSVLSQNIDNIDNIDIIKVIVVNDGSTDGGEDVVAAYQERGVQLINQKNQGESAARNAGVAAAETEYVAFLDADDWWLPNHLKVLLQLIERHPEAGLLSTSHLIRRDQLIYRAKSGMVDGWSGLVKDFFREYSKGLSIVNSSTACVKKSVLIEVGGFPVGIRRGPDIMTWISIALAYPVAHTNIPTSVFNQEAVNRSDLHRETEPPNSLLMLKEIICYKNDPSVAMLFDSMALMTAAGYRLKDNFQAAKAIGRLAYSAKRYKVAGLITIVNILPIWALSFARKRRHGVAQANMSEE